MKKLIFPILILFLTSCNSWKFVSKYDDNAEFNNYNTFGLLSWDPHNDEIIRPETKKYILMAIKSQLESRGYTYQKNNADLQISIFAVVREETSYSAYSDHYAGYSGYGGVAVGVGVGTGGAGVGVIGYGMPGQYPFTAVKHDYNTGTVVVDMLDPAKKRVVWQGVASGIVKDAPASESTVNNYINRLFAKFPVKKQKKK